MRETLWPTAAIIAPLGEEFAGIDGAQLTEQELLEMLARRPCTVRDMSAGLGVHRNEVVKFVTKLLGEGRIEAKERNGETYYRRAG